MAKGVYTEILHVPIRDVWAFVSDLNQWAPLMPGYVDHHILNDQESIWDFIADVGFKKKRLQVKVVITEWQEPSRIRFQLSGWNEAFIGEGMFTAEDVTAHSTKMIGHLEMKTKGVKAPVINGILKSIVPQQTKKLTKTMASQIVKRNYVATTTS
ncbi:CoxG family protein [Lentibacillus saliphilus]|uniref:CoxG family protein n=1 Tax=Lentibacillus saliphilus TaxID=2737028 RepID=UPI001C2F1AEA|nr:SRPBCC family protein [Lentibacillus saliphilus]